MTREGIPETFTVSETKETSGKDKNISPLKEYFKAVNNSWLVFILLILLIIPQIVQTGTDYWVAYW